MGESEMKHLEISRCHRTDVYLLYLTLVTRGHNCGQAARVYLAHFVMAKSIFFLFCYTRILSLSHTRSTVPTLCSPYLFQQSRHRFRPSSPENHRFETTTDRRNPREKRKPILKIADLLPPRERIAHISRVTTALNTSTTNKIAEASAVLMLTTCIHGKSSLLLPAAADVEFLFNRKAVNALNITRRAL